MKAPIRPIRRRDTHRMPRAAMATGVAVAAAVSSACSVLSPAPTFELIKASGTAASYWLASGPVTASDTVHHQHATPRSICIEFNRDAQTAEVVPALQAELRKHQVESRVYETGTPSDVCPVWLRYTAAIDWDTPFWEVSYRAYLSQAALTLRDADGTVLASSAYQPRGFYELGKWSSTRDKLAPVVTALLTGFER